MDIPRFDRYGSNPNCERYSLMCDTQWTRRGIWNKPYYEAKGPEVPAMLLELLSHQNFADMRYGLDPQFQFLVCRSIYKGILKYFFFRKQKLYSSAFTSYRF